MELDELLREARIRYPIGTKFKCVKDDTKAIVEKELVQYDGIYTEMNSNPYYQYVYFADKWAEIISSPVIHFPYLTKLLKKLGVK